MGPRSCGVERDLKRCLPGFVLDGLLGFFLFDPGAGAGSGAPGPGTEGAVGG